MSANMKTLQQLLNDGSFAVRIAAPEPITLKSEKDGGTYVCTVRSRQEALEFVREQESYGCTVTVIA